MLMFLFAVTLGWLPTSRQTGLSSFILPSITLGLFATSGQVRILRSALLEVLDSEYVRLARAKGVSPWLVIWKHALRNALIAPLTFAGLTLAGMITGSIIVETVFSWPGLGLLAVQSVNNSDFPIIQGVILVVTLAFVTANLIVDVLYMLVDPRIRV
jgi:peptide/nickel transport system permease protein